MAKPKRKDSFEADVSGGNKRQKAVYVDKKTKVQGLQEGQKRDGAMIPASKDEGGLASASSAPEALRIIIGSYEKVLCGIDATFDDKSNKVQRLVNPAHTQNNLVLNPVYMFSAHTGAIKCLATSDRYLVSGGSDEVIKY